MNQPKSACENCGFDQTARFFELLRKYFDEIEDKLLKTQKHKRKTRHPNRLKNL